MALVPTYVSQWFAQQQWKLLAHQRAMLEAFAARQHTLLIAPTGTGKTLAGFLPSLVDIHARKAQGLHTLYISPLKALTQDIERNLMQPIEGMGLNVRVESRTGDTPAHRRTRQRAKPPHILLTTPESLMLMLSYADAPQLFAGLQCVVIDEIHHLAPNKRGDMLALALAQLQQLGPQHVRLGLSATVAQPALLAQWLGPQGCPAHIHQAKPGKAPKVRVLPAQARIPYSGHMAHYAVPDILAAIAKARTSLVFVNTRAQAELMFQLLWEANSEGLPIGIFHSALTREKRQQTLKLMGDGKLRALVSTSALEMGLDWGDVDLVIQVGAPKGISRLLQRIGRSNHKLDTPSEAYLVPSNRFEQLECRAAMDAIKAGTLDGEMPQHGSEDVVIQWIMNCACSAPVTPASLYATLQHSWVYRHLTQADMERLFAFVRDGGYALRAYERFQRLVAHEGGGFVPAHRSVVQRHRQNIGVIVEAGKVKVKRLAGRGGSILGEVEEQFAQGLRPGDTFYFAGQVLSFVALRDMMLECRAAKATEPKIPSFVGGQMPLSTFLASGVRHLLDGPEHWAGLSADTREWLGLQQRFSQLPGSGHLLVESFPRHGVTYTVFYTFEGRRANQTLGMLLTRRMERMGLSPLTFTLTDYALSIATVERVGEAEAQAMLAPDILFDELEEWLADSPMLKRSFRRVATIAGLVEQNHGAARKTMKQVTFSTDLIYDVLRKYEPDHVLLRITRAEAERELLDTERLAELLHRFQGKLCFMPLTRPSPMCLSVILDVRTERVPGRGMEALLEQLSKQQIAEQLMEEVRDALA